jgi:hypothetical protein
MTLSEMASELLELQAKENDGRGVSCVRSVCTFLSMGRLDLAENVAQIDFDKVRNYPRLATWINIHLFPQTPLK